MPAWKLQEYGSCSREISVASARCAEMREPGRNHRPMWCHGLRHKSLWAHLGERVAILRSTGQPNISAFYMGDGE